VVSGVRRLGPLSGVHTGQAMIDRALDGLVTRTNSLLRGAFAQAVPLEVTLSEGLNKVPHPLGVAVAHFTHAALPAEDVFLSSDQPANQFPDRQVWVRMTGASSVRALLFLFPSLG
jgi:hypothetical protein